MIQDREMVMDALETVKHEIIDLTKAAEECSNQDLRQSILEFRNQAEQTQVQLAQFASERGWYIPSPAADHSQVQQVKQHLQNGANQTNNRPMGVRV